MDRINTSTKAVDLFGAGKHGFKDGDLALGVVPTDLDAEWCNSLQEELLAVIEGASLVPSGASLTQLKQAVQILAGINDKSIAANGWVRLPSGVILQWGQATMPSSSASSFSTTGITWPLAWPNGYLAGVVLQSGHQNGTSLVACYAIEATTLTAGNIVRTASGAVSNAQTVRWIAVGS